MKSTTRSFPMKFSAWTKSVGVSRPTAYRWRELGWLKLGLNGETPLQINGCLYVRENEDADFWARANKREFATKAGGVVVTQKKARAK